MAGLKLNDYERALFEEHAALDGVPGLTTWMKQVCVQYCLNKDEGGVLTDQKLKNELMAHRAWVRTKFGEVMEKLEQWDG